MSVLLEKILSRGNMRMALDKVKSNKGAGGIDGIETENIDQLPLISFCRRGL